MLYVHSKKVIIIYGFIAPLYFTLLQKHQNRSMVVHPDEQVLWKDVQIEDMSGESDDPENPNNLHRPKWCSTGKC